MIFFLSLFCLAQGRSGFLAEQRNFWMSLVMKQEDGHEESESFFFLQG